MLMDFILIVSVLKMEFNQEVDWLKKTARINKEDCRHTGCQQKEPGRV